MKHHSILAAAIAAAATAVAAVPADTIKVESFMASKPLTLVAPLMTDSVDAQGKSFDLDAVVALNRHAPLKLAGSLRRGDSFAPDTAVTSTGRASFAIDVNTFAKGIVLCLPDGVKAYVNGEAYAAPLNLKPGTYKVELDWLSHADGVKPRAEVAVVVPGDHKGKVSVVSGDNKGRRPSLADFSDGRHSGYLSLSPSGEYLTTWYNVVAPGGRKRDSYCRIVRTADNSPVGAPRRDNPRWMPSTDRLWGTRLADDGTTTLYAADPVTGSETILTEGLPEGPIAISPTEDFAILTTYTDGPAEGDVYQVLEPEDRQPGWRRRGRLWKVDFATGAVTPLTFGYRQTWLNDISADGGKILFTTSHSRYTKRPTTLRDIIVLDLATLAPDTVVAADGFANSALFSPDGSKVLIQGTPEALGGIGLDLPEGRTASMTEGELFIVDLASKAVTPVTKSFDPSVSNAEWSRADGRIYFTAEDRDFISLFAYDPAGNTIRRADTGEEENISNFSLPVKGNLMAWRGSGASNSDRVYLTDLRRHRTTMLDDPSAERLADLALGQCHAWDYVTSRGDTVNARYYLPADFDPAKKYPVIVNYYGGCSPTSRMFESRYPHHLYAAQGYAVLVINPSGCTGRGQEWASRHVNTAGEGVAQDIIEGTQQFCRLNEWTDSTALGCIGASYGGFMTQYLQTQTPMFAAAISHAGISDHTSYWGEGYWGYSYSEVSMADSYPWTRSDLYVGQSPLFLADRITTPLLFLHGDSDNNVPYGESIQMFTALKLLGRPTALVAVADQDHHILDYDKRIKWQDTIFAWFEKYLKKDSTWWDTLYPPKSL